jgi:hypothetical protein
MDHKFAVEEWAQLSWSERIRQCRLMAEAARQLAERATPEMREQFNDLARGWADLAHEIEATTVDE